MSRNRAQFAKLTRPRLYGAIPRARLFSRLDEVRSQRPAICVVGPPGSGKTTLVASWLEARKLPTVWYQVDSGDADIATFFYYLGEAARSYGGRKGRLPMLTAEYREDLAGFSRRFFRALFDRLPRAASLVLDNYQEVAHTETFHELIADAVAEVPVGATLVIVSRSDPPQTYARLVANEQVGFLDWEDLRLTLDETRAIAIVRNVVTHVEIDRLHAQSGGWAAGLTLLLESKRNQIAVREPGPSEGLQAVFDYFASQIFTGLPEHVRQFLVFTACLPQVEAATARELTGESRSEEILRELYQRHLFIHRRPGDEPVYWYHALFRSFLLAQAEHSVPDAKWRSTLRRGGELFEEKGAFDEAFELYRSAKDWDAATRVVLQRAEILLSHGRSEILGQWIQSLPPTIHDRQPWLPYWLGMAMLSSAPTAARLDLERAFRGFVHLRNRLGQLEAAAAIIQSYFYDWLDFESIDPWIQTVTDYLSETTEALPPSLQLKVSSSLVTAMLYRAPCHPMLESRVDKVEALLDGDLSADQKLIAATFLVSYCTLAGQLERGVRIVVKMERFLAKAEVAPAKLLWWRIRLCFFHSHRGEYEEAAASLQRSTDIANRFGLETLRSARMLALTYEATLFRCWGDLDRGERSIEQMAQLADPGVPIHRWWIEEARDQQALSQGTLVVKHVKRTVELADETGAAYPRITSRINYAYALCASGDRDGFEQTIAQIRRMIGGSCFAFYEAELRLLQAYAVLCEGTGESPLTALRDALRFARKVDYFYEYRSLLGYLPAACAKALAAGIEPDYVQELIARYRLAPPPSATDAWPWSVKIYALGRFEVLTHGTPLTFGRKAPKRPLAVLKTIISSGKNTLSVERLMDALWPDEDGDAAYQALAKSVQRLRRLLRDDKAVSLTQGKVVLDPQRVWVDAFAVDALAAADQSDPTIASERLFELYKGPFLDGEEEFPSYLSAQRRLRDKFILLVLQHGARLESTGRRTAAEQLYARALEIDSTADAVRYRLQARANTLA